MKNDEEHDFADSTLDLLFQTGATFAQSLRSGWRWTQPRASETESSPESRSISPIPSLKSICSAPLLGKPDTIPPFVLPTRESVSPLRYRKGLFQQDFGSINPALYQSTDDEDGLSFPDEHIGRLWFQLSYERDAEKLTVTIVKAKNIPIRHDKSLPDPFIRLVLLPDERRSLQTKVKRKTCNPRFDESFVFPVTIKELPERTLRFSVLDIDRWRKHNVIGHVIYPMSEFSVNSSEKFRVIYRDLDKDQNEVNVGFSHGELLVSLCYNSELERLTVNIVEARGLRSKESGVSPDSFVRVALTKQSKAVKTVKTQIVKCSSCPKFNESFQFKLSSDATSLASLLVIVEDCQAKKKDCKVLGRITLGGMMFSRGKELEHWEDAIQKEKEHVQDWHSLT